MAVLVVEDDLFYAARLREMLSDHGVDCVHVSSAEEALAVPLASYDSAILDVMLPNDPARSGVTVEESRGGFLSGVAVARRLLNARPGLKVLLITADDWGAECARWAKSNRVPVAFKADGPAAVRGALQTLGVLGGDRTPRAFIVHGHDEAALLQLKNYIQNTLRWREPVVLREQPNCGKTLIEKFEEFSEQIDCAFVLLTPDDPIVLKSLKEPRRCRQNVIFELGFFLAQLGRRSGRVVVLYKEPNELPSDIAGVTWIGINEGVEAAGEQIRRELALFARDDVPK